jgi:16S rRNA (adenine1518-N6/adenine1519-N6)-dimethyltransferase
MAKNKSRGTSHVPSELGPKKHLGQHFLTDPRIAARIAEAATLLGRGACFEIGPGKGILTQALAERFSEVVAVELDKRMVAHLEERFAGGNIHLIHGDVLKADLRKIANDEASGGPLAVAGNLPYQITSPVLEWIVKYKDAVQLAVLMVQFEVAQRMAAGPGEEDYSAFSVFCRYHFAPEVLFRVSPGSFFPRPRVTSAVIRLLVRETPPVEIDEGKFFGIVKQAFGQRRKMLRSALRLSFQEAARIQQQTGIDLTRRGETLSLEDFACLARAMT